MTSLPRANFNTLLSDLSTRMDGAITVFASERGLTYDAPALRSQCVWTEDAALDVLMFGFDTFPNDGDEDDGEPMFPIPMPVNDTGRTPRLMMAAAVLLAVTVGLFTSMSVHDIAISASSTHAFIHDATLPVTGTSALIPDGVG